MSFSGDPKDSQYSIKLGRCSEVRCSTWVFAGKPYDRGQNNAQYV